MHTLFKGGNLESLFEDKTKGSRTNSNERVRRMGKGAEREGEQKKKGERKREKGREEGDI